MIRRRAIQASVLLAAIFVAFLVSIWVLFGISYSPRLEALDPHIRFGATRAEFVAVIREHQFPFEADNEHFEMVELRVPLDGTERGNRLQLRFRSTGELVWAAVIDGTGKIVQFRLHVRW